jgi:hypothetical protein
MRIRVRIDRVILDGVPIAAAQARSVRAAIESELGRLIVEQGLPGGLAGGRPRGGTTPSLRAPDTRVTREHPAGTGRRIAGAVYRSLGAAR